MNIKGDNVVSLWPVIYLEVFVMERRYNQCYNHKHLHSCEDLVPVALRRIVSSVWEEDLSSLGLVPGPSRGRAISSARTHQVGTLPADRCGRLNVFTGVRGSIERE